MGYLSAVEFGKRLIETEDLDPVYMSLYKSGLSHEELKRWTITWMCYYHCGLSCTMMRGNLYDAILAVAEAESGPRGSQRVHHRGPPAIKSAIWLREMFNTASDLFDWIEQDGMHARSIYGRCCQMEGFGMCMGWRIPDIGERCGFEEAVWSDECVYDMYDNPRKGAVKTAENYGLDMKDPLMSSHQYLMEHLGHMLAPPGYERTINIQETETVFCKWKSHIVGRYEVGRDTLRARKQFLAYPKNKLSQHLLRHLPKV